MEEIIKSTLAYFGSGILGALLVAGIQWARVSRSEKEKRHSEYVFNQISKLYGPLFFLTSQNQELFKLSNKILSAHREHFNGKNWSRDTNTQKTIKDESLSTIELSNEYISHVVKNNEEIIKILQENFSYIDADDIEIIRQFIVDTIRMNKEVREERLKKIPYEVYKSVGNISYSRPEFLTRIEEKFFKKQSIIKEYH